MDHALMLHEEVMLLALREDKGTIERGAWYQHAAAGAVLAELSLAERVRIVADGKKRTIEVLSAEPLGDELTDEWLARIAEDKKVRTAGHWVSKIAGTKDLKGRIARTLAERGILRVDEDKILLLFTREVYPEMDPGPEEALRGRLREAVIDRADEVDPRTSVLLSLAMGTGLINLVFDRSERREHKQRIEDIVNGEACGRAARDLVAATQMVIMMSCIAVAATAS